MRYSVTDNLVVRLPPITVCQVVTLTCADLSMADQRDRLISESLLQIHDILIYIQHPLSSPPTPHPTTDAVESAHDHNTKSDPPGSH